MADEAANKAAEASKAAAEKSAKYLADADSKANWRLPGDNDIIFCCGLWPSLPGMWVIAAFVGYPAYYYGPEYDTEWNGIAFLNFWILLISMVLSYYGGLTVFLNAW